MRVIVTGGAGFIGSHLCRELLRQKHQVIAIDNLSTSDGKNIAPLFKNSNFTFYKRDMTTPVLFFDIDRIYHLASPASPKDYMKSPVQTLWTNASGTFHALGLAKINGARFLLASTSEVYGDPHVTPQAESYNGNVSCTGPRSCYDEGKRYAEALTMAYRREHGLDTRIARIFNTYGPGMRVDDGRAIPTFIYQAINGHPITIYGDGSQTRSFCYVSDLVRGLIALMESDYPHPVNLGNPEEITIKELALKIAGIFKSRQPICFRNLPEDDPKRRRPDLRAAKELLKWAPKITLDQGLRKMR